MLQKPLCGNQMCQILIETESGYTVVDPVAG